jgi:hypothetical protein
LPKLAKYGEKVCRGEVSPTITSPMEFNDEVKRKFLPGFNANVKPSFKLHERGTDPFDEIVCEFFLGGALVAKQTFFKKDLPAFRDLLATLPVEETI